MTIAERKQEIAEMQGALKDFIEKRDVESAKAKKEEIRQAKELLVFEEEEAQEAIRAAEENMEVREEQREMGKEISKELRARAFLKNVAKKELTEEERSAVASLTGEGAVIPEEFVNKKQDLTYGDDDLEARCQVIPVTSVQGSIPVQELNGFLAELDDNGKIVGATPSLSAVDYKVLGKFAITGLNNDTIESTPLSAINDIIIPDYNVRAKNTKNKDIMASVSANSTSVTVGASDKVEDVLAKTISKAAPSYRNGLVVVTNAEGYSHLDNLKDVSGRKDDRVTEMNGKLYFKNKEVIALDDTVLPALTASKTMVFYVVNLKTIPFCKMKQTYIQQSNGEFGFDTDKTFYKVSTKFGVAKVDKALVKGKKLEA